MLNEEKIKLMTSIGMFEKREGRRIFMVNRFFRSDYIGRHGLRAFLGFTWKNGGEERESGRSSRKLDILKEPRKGAANWLPLFAALIYVLFFILPHDRIN